MTTESQTLLLRHLPHPEEVIEGEAALLPKLMRWLVVTGRLRSQTQVAYEVPWLGRRVDLALLTSGGVTTAFELKIGRLQRVLEQATYNRSSFHRSWVVTANHPRPEGLRWAQELGLGLLVVKGDAVTPLINPSIQDPHPATIKRLRSAIRARAEVST